MKGDLGKFLIGVMIFISLLIVLAIVVASLGPTPLSIASRADQNTRLAGLVSVVTASKSLQPATTLAPLQTVGQNVIVDKVRWKILSVDNLGNRVASTNSFIKDKVTSGKFIKVHFEIENRSKDMLSFAGLDLIDSKGRKYTRSSESFPGIESDETCFIENLNPNITKTCVHVFEVPADATGLKASVGDLKILGDAEALIDLGM